MEKSNTFYAVCGIHESTIFSEFAQCLKNISLMWFSKTKYFNNKQIRVTLLQWLFTVSVLKKVAYFTKDLLQVSNDKIRGTDSSC